jgi:molecular chaperone GrpE
MTDTQQTMQEETLRNDGVTEAQPEAGQPESEAPTVESLTAERDAYLEQLQRSVAEFQNFRRRVESERERMREVASREVIRAILPVLDDVQRAIAAMPPEGRETSWGEGIAAIERKFLGILERIGVTPINQTGEPFDPAKHEAVATEPGSTGSVVVEVYQTGYQQGETLLRPAMVKVGDPVQMQA